MKQMHRQFLNHWFRIGRVCLFSGHQLWFKSLRPSCTVFIKVLMMDKVKNAFQNLLGGIRNRRKIATPASVLEGQTSGQIRHSLVEQMLFVQQGGGHE